MMARYEILEHALHRARWSWGDDWESAACDVVFETSDQAAAWSDYAARSPRDMFEVEARTRGGYGRMRDAGYRVELLRIWTSDPTSEEADAETVASWEWTYDDHMREEREAGEMADYRDIEREALEYMGEHAGDWDVDAVVREVMGMGAGSIDELDPDEWTGILQRHDGEGPGAGKVFDDAGWPIDFGAAVELMDDGLREEIHMRMAPCSDQRFMDAYAAEHVRRFGEGFPPYCNGEW